MTEMVERVAKALWDLYQSHPYTRFGSNDLAFGQEWKGKIVPWEYLLTDQVVSSCAEEYRVKARTAITAMREPTEEMADAADDTDALCWSLEPGEGLDAVRWSVAWKAMIDEALK